MAEGIFNEGLDALRKKYGPFTGWTWGGIGGALVAVFVILRHRSSTASTTTATQDVLGQTPVTYPPDTGPGGPTDTPVTPSTPTTPATPIISAPPIDIVTPTPSTPATPATPSGPTAPVLSPGPQPYTPPVGASVTAGALESAIVAAANGGSQSTTSIEANYAPSGYSGPLTGLSQGDAIYLMESKLAELAAGGEPTGGAFVNPVKPVDSHLSYTYTGTRPGVSSPTPAVSNGNAATATQGNQGVQKT